MARRYAIERHSVRLAQLGYCGLQVFLRLFNVIRIGIAIGGQVAVIGIILAVIVKYGVFGQQRIAAEEFGVVRLPYGGKGYCVYRAEYSLAEVFVLHCGRHFGVLGLEVPAVPIGGNGLFGKIYIVLPFAATYAGNFFGGEGRAGYVAALEHVKA